MSGVLLLVSALLAAAPVEQPRSFGHFIGDVLTQRIALDADGRQARLVRLPPADRIGLWLERLPPRLETDARGRHWLTIDYQIINSPVSPLETALPALALATATDEPLRTNAWPISISPLSPKPAYANIAPPPLRGDRVPLPLPTAGLERTLTQGALALALILAAWLGCIAAWNRRDAERLPFARALRQLQSLAAPDAEAEGWIIVHRALDATAGYVVRTHSVARLLDSAPQLTPLRAELHEFYRRSDARFFARPPDHTPFPLAALCRKLRRLEKRQDARHAAQL